MNNERLKRSYRLIKIIQEIKTTPYQTISHLLKSLAISRAQFYKDRDALAQLGFEFHYDRGKGRFIITKDSYLPIENLTLSERISLLMAVRQLSASGDYLLTYEGLNAARKLTAELPGPLRENAISLFDDLVLKEGFGCRMEIMEKLQQAMSENRRVILTYQKPEEVDPIEVELDPYHLFFQRRALYVEGYSVNSKAVRMYRLNRIREVKPTPVQCPVREDYDFGLRHKNAFSAFPGETTQRVVVRFSNRVRPYIEESLWHHSQVITRGNNGAITLEVAVAEPREVMWWAFQWGADAEIIEPQWLRKQTKKEIGKMVNRYD